MTTDETRKNETPTEIVPDTPPNTKDPQPIRNVKGKTGPKAKDWEALYQEWVTSGLPRLEFLESKGIARHSAQSYRCTRDWEARFSGKTNEMMSRRASSLSRSKARVAQVVPSTPEVDKAKVAAVVGLKARDVSDDAMGRGWNAIMTWRAKQAHNDWQDADRVRLIIKVMLKNALIKSSTTHPDGTVEDGWTTKIKAHEVKALMQTLGEAQRVQRLALGLSTENIGIDSPDTNIERGAQEAEKSGVPLFIVEMSKGGKFSRARPRRVR